MKSKKFYSHGKLLLSGEYVVLDGAISLAIPTKYGQSLEVKPINERKLIWQSLDDKGNEWFEHTYKFEEICYPFIYESQIETYTNAVSKTLLKILFNAIRMNPSFFSEYLDDYDDNGQKIDGKGFRITTKLEFPKNWGLGTSSTLINNIAQWTNVDAFNLLEKTFGGSGYDIACAKNNKAITYQLNSNYNEILNQVQDDKMIINEVNFDPSFKEHLYFVHLNKKQNSRDGIKHYHKNKENTQSAIASINTITLEMITSKTLEHFQSLMVKHETIISKITKQPPVKSILFNDFEGAIKSLGAWGGDFIMVASKHNPSLYFKDRGYETVIPYSKMAL